MQQDIVINLQKTKMETKNDTATEKEMQFCPYGVAC